MTALVFESFGNMLTGLVVLGVAGLASAGFALLMAHFPGWFGGNSVR